MKKINKYSYWILTPALIIGFFLFTGGIMSSSDDHNTAVAPTINSFIHEPERVFNNQQVKFIADVSANSSSSKYDSQDCGDEENFESPSSLESKIEITRNGISIVSDEFEWMTDEQKFVYTYTFLTPGTYKIIATFKTNWSGTSPSTDSGRRSTPEEMTLIVKDEGMNLSGTYRLSKFVAECNEGPKLEKSSGLGSTLTINETGHAALNVNVAFSEAEREGRPCIGEGYNFSGSGQIQIVENDDGSRVLRIQYGSNVHLEYGYSFNGTALSLSYNDTNGNKFSFRFTK